MYYLCNLMNNMANVMDSYFVSTSINFMHVPLFVKKSNIFDRPIITLIKRTIRVLTNCLRWAINWKDMNHTYPFLISQVRPA